MILTDYFKSERDATWDFALQSGVKHGVIRLPEDDAFNITEKSHWEKVYKKFIDYVKARNVGLNELLGAKYKDGRWAMTSYNLHRSIVDSYQTYNRHYKDRDMFTSIANSQRKDRLNRESIIPELLIQTDKDYVDGQISLFDLPVEEETTSINVFFIERIIRILKQRKKFMRLRCVCMKFI